MTPQERLREIRKEAGGGSGNFSIGKHQRLLEAEVVRLLEQRGTSLFMLGDFKLHSGRYSRFKIDCDALTEADWDTLAFIGMEKLGWPDFYAVLSVPRGGDRFAVALEKYKKNYGTVLLVDDVLTTGQSIEAHRRQSPAIKYGLVVFARGECPSWVTPIFQM